MNHRWTCQENLPGTRVFFPRSRFVHRAQDTFPLMSCKASLKSHLDMSKSSFSIVWIGQAASWQVLNQNKIKMIHSVPQHPIDWSCSLIRLMAIFAAIRGGEIISFWGTSILLLFLVRTGGLGFGIGMGFGIIGLSIMGFSMGSGRRSKGLDQPSTAQLAVGHVLHGVHPCRMDFPPGPELILLRVQKVLKCWREFANWEKQFVCKIDEHLSLGAALSTCRFQHFGLGPVRVLLTQTLLSACDVVPVVVPQANSASGSRLCLPNTQKGIDSGSSRLKC